MFSGKLVRLRAIVKSDLPALIAWRDDVEIRQSVGGWSFPVSLEQESAWLENSYSDPHNKRLAIERLDNQTYIGNIGLYQLDWKNRTAEYGILIGDKSAWGKGFAADATDILLRFAFEEMGLHRVWLRVLAYHKRAIALYEKIGFQYEGRLREDTFRNGQYHDTLMMAILDSEYRKDT